MKVCVLTTSYPRSPGDFAGAFVANAVEHLRAAGVEVRVVSPSDFRHFGIAYGDGIANNLRARPWLVLLLPLFFVSFSLAARRASRDADVVHAHWLPSAVAALATGKPFVLQAWGSDVELARRAPWLFRPLVQRARVVVCATGELADDALSLGGVDVRVITPGVDIPDATGRPEEPPHVLYAGRLSEEKGVRDLAEVASGLPLVVVGDGPLRELFPQCRGFVRHDEIGRYYERASVVVVPSRREGYGFAAREAMAYGRAVVATQVGGLVEAISDEVDGLLVEPRRPGQLRAALDRLLADEALRTRLGAAAQAKARQHFAWPAATSALIAAYGEAAGRSRSDLTARS